MIRISIIFITAILISVVAAYFSIVGLAALFAATYWGVVVMGVSLEAGKVVAATWAHEHWGDPHVSKLHKGYLVGAVGALMVVTSLGIYGHLSKGHLEQSAPMAGTNLQIQQGELRIQQIQADNDRLTTRLAQLDQSVNVMLGQDRASQGLRARSQQRGERAEINAAMDANNKQIQEVQTSLLPLKTANLEVEAKLGPVKYVAELFGWKDPEVAVRMIILIIMVAFDPLALVLIISGGISLRRYQEQKRLEAEAKRDNDFKGIQEGLNDAMVMDKEYAPTTMQEDFNITQPSEGRGTRVTEFPRDEDISPEVLKDVSYFSAKLATTNPVFIPTGPMLQATPESAFPFMQELEEHGTVQEKAEEIQLVAELEIAEQTESPVESVSEQDEPVLSDKEQLLNMLEKNPDILQDIIEVVDTYRKPQNHIVRLTGNNESTDPS